MDIVKRISNSKLAQNSVWLVALRLFNTVMPILTLPYVTRILSASAYGEFSVALSWITYFQVIVEYGFGLSGAKKAAVRKDDSELNEVFSNIIYSRTFLFICCLCVFLITVNIAPISETQMICMGIMFAMVFSLIFQQNWFFQGISEMKHITIIGIIGRIVSVVLIFIFVKKPADIYVYCILNSFGNILTSVLGVIIVVKKYKVKLVRYKFSAIISEIKDGWALFVSTAIGSIFGSVGITILGFVAVSSVVGVYSAISKIPSVITLLFSALAQALYPNSCKAFETGFKNGVSSVKKYGTPIFLFFLICGIGIIVLNKPIVLIAFGEEYAASSLLLVPFMIWQTMGILNNFLGIQILTASGHQKEYSISFTVSIIIMLSLMYILGQIWGAYGVAIASMCSEFALTAFLIIYIHSIKKKEM